VDDGVRLRFVFVARRARILAHATLARLSLRTLHAILAVDVDGAR